MNDNHTLDLGPRQINSCHWFNMPEKSPYGRFCKKMGWDRSDCKTLCYPRKNYLFAAYLNECFLETGQASYVYDDGFEDDGVTPTRTRKLYVYLLKKMRLADDPIIVIKRNNFLDRLRVVDVPSGTTDKINGRI